MTNNQQGFQNVKRQPGSYTVEDNKLRINNLNGISSVLFEDISSISFKAVSFPNLKLLFGGIFAIFLGFAFASNESEGAFQLFIIVGIVCMILSFIYPEKWDNVMIETRGGLLLYYSVDFGQGIKQVNSIEEEKRRNSRIIETPKSKSSDEEKTE